MDIRVSRVNSGVPVTIIQPRGDVDASNYRHLIEKARDLCGGGALDMLIDLSQVPYLSSSGLLALHSIALMVRGEQLPDAEGSWAALRAFDRERERGVAQHLKLVGPQSKVSRVLDMAGFTRFLEVHTDLDTAVTSFQEPQG